MIIELILASVIGQQKELPLAPHDDVQVVVIDNTKVLNDQSNKIAALERSIADLKNQRCPHCKKLPTDPVDEQKVVKKDKPDEKYIMSDRWGRKYGNDNYEQLLADINFLNSQPGPVDLLQAVKKMRMNANAAPIVQEQPQFYMPTMNNMGVGVSCAPGGS